MSNPRDIALLLDMMTAAQRILDFTDGMDAIGFKHDVRTHLAVQHQLMVIGEAAKHLTPEYRVGVKDISLSAVARMRDRLIHGYDTVDLDVVWDTVQKDIPLPVHAIREHLED